MAGITISDPVSTVLGIGGKILDHFFPDPAKKAEAQLELLKLAQTGDLSIAGYQSEINKAEASNPNMFVAGWRPFVGWTCGLGLFSQFILRPMSTFVAGLFGYHVEYPSLEMGTLMTLLGGMLGLGGMRTLEKLQGAEGNR